GGSNDPRRWTWKKYLAAFALESGLEITVCHFPPGTSKWNKIEHRMFCHITANWRGRPLTSYEVVIETIAATTTRSRLTIAPRQRAAHGPGPGPGPLPPRRPHHRRRVPGPADHARRVPRRLELHAGTRSTADPGGAGGRPADRPRPDRDAQRSGPDRHATRR